MQEDEYGVESEVTVLRPGKVYDRMIECSNVITFIEFLKFEI